MTWEISKFLAPIYKMETQSYELKPNSYEEFNTFTKGKGFKGRNNYALKELKARNGFKIETRALVVSSNDMGPTKFDSMRKAAKAISVGEGVIRYARNNNRNFVKRFGDGKALSVMVFS